MIVKLILVFILGTFICNAQQDSIAFEKEYSKALSHYRSSEYDSAVICWLKSENYAERRNITYDRAKCFSNIGTCYKLQAKYDSAFMYFDKGIKLIEPLDSLKLLGQLNNNIGTACLETGTFENAQKHFIKALNYKKKANDEKGMGSTLLNLGEVQLRLKNYSSARAYYNQSLKIRKAYQDTFGIASCYLNLGILHKNAEEFQESKSYYDQILKLCEEEFGRSQIIKLVTLENFGSLYFAQGDLDTALKFYNMGEVLAKKLDSPSDIAFCNHEKALLHLENKEPLKAKPLVEHAYSIAKEQGYLEGEVLYSKTVSLVYNALNKYQEAFDWMELHIKLNDSILNIEKINHINSLEYQYQSTLLKKENEIQTQQIKTEQIEKEKEKMKTSRVIWIATLLGTLLLIVIFFMLRLKNRKNQIKKKNIKLNDEIDQRKYYQQRFYETAGQKLSVANKHSKREELDLKDIILIRKHTGSNLANIYTTGGNIYTKPISINTILKKELKDSFFTRVNKSELVNLHYIKSIEEDTIVVELKSFNTDKEKFELRVERLKLFKQGQILDDFLSNYSQFSKKKNGNQIE